MKKSYLKNIITILVLTVFSVSGITGTSVFCISDCCSSENSCCEQSAQSESITKRDCCEFSQTFQTEKKAVTTFIKTIVVITPVTFIHHNSSETTNRNFISSDLSPDHIRSDQFKSILRI